MILKPSEISETQPMPSVFVSHGPPSILLMETQPAKLFLENLGRLFPKPRAILCVSAHFESMWPILTSSRHPELIYDFSGPHALYEKAYPVPGDPDLACHVADILRQKGLKVDTDDQRGIDHGVWVPLSLMYPEADVPVVQLSIQSEEKPSYHIKLGKMLSVLRNTGVLILGSGGATHNLSDIYGKSLYDPPAPYALNFMDWLKKILETGDVDGLADYNKRGPHAAENHPYPAEHFLPLLVSAGAAFPEINAETLFQGFMYGMLSMASFAWGMGTRI